MKTSLLFTLAGLAGIALFSCNKTGSGVMGREVNKIVYVESNDYHDNSNAILAYMVKPDGTLDALPGSPFLTKGAGLGNPKQVLGPDDSDNPIIISDDGLFLLAVNGGSNTIAVFSINGDGSLQPVPGSPFPSGGQTPCSIAMNGDFIYVTNKSLDPLHTITEAPNYIAFTADRRGRLSEVPGSKVEEAAGSAPSQVLVSNDHQFLFGADFLAFMLPMEQPVGSLLSFKLGANGSLKAAPGSPYVLPSGDGGALGLWQHPSSQTLYVGFPVKSSFGVYSIDSHSGALSLQQTIAAGAAACWLRTNREGDRLYVLNSGENSVSVYNTSTPSSPVFVSKLFLKEPGPLYTTPMGMMAPSSEDFALGFSPKGNDLYVVSQNTNPDPGAGNFNYLHVLAVAQDGMLSEGSDPLQLPVRADVRPQGVATR